MQKALNYNEKKVQKGVATCLYAGNFLKDAKQLNFQEKLRHFKRLTELNTRAKTNTLHISLNFHPSEKLGSDTLIQVAARYLDKIGFGAQPYLVYEHRDAGHPHVHIVTTPIQENGKRINTQNIGRHQSQVARKAIEKEFGLLRAEGKKQPALENAPLLQQKIQYGKTDTRRAITNVLQTVLSDYRYASLPELNAVLQLYHLMADPGKEGSRIHQHQGLVYRVLDAAGNKVGVPLKASAIAFRPTLRYLEQRFDTNRVLKPALMPRLRTAVDFVMHQRPATLDDFMKRLNEEKVAVVLRQNAQGFVYGITYVDHRTKGVFNGSELGKPYSAAQIQERIQSIHTKEPSSTNPLLEKGDSAKKPFAKDAQPRDATHELSGHVPAVDHQGKTVVESLVSQLLEPSLSPSHLPHAVRKKKKKKRKL